MASATAVVRGGQFQRRFAVRDTVQHQQSLSMGGEGMCSGLTGPA